MSDIAKRTGIAGPALALLGIALVIFQLSLVFFWVPTEAVQGVIQRIFYLHVPSAWVAFFAFGIVALSSVVYLWLGDERADRAAQAAAEGGMVFTTVVLISGPLWGKIAWGTYWTWEARLTLTLLLWFIYLGYFMVRGAASSPEKGKKFSAVVGILGAVNIPLIHMSVYWFRSLHPSPVILKPDGPTAPPEMVQTLLLGFLSYTVLFLGLMILRIGVLRVEQRIRLREANA